MTSDEIKAKPATDLTVSGWLREIAIQLSLLNEKQPLSVRETAKLRAQQRPN